MRVPARELVDEVLRNLSAGIDVETLHSLELEGRETIMDLVENDHPLAAPFYVRSSDDVRRGWDYDRRIQRLDVVKANEVTATTLLTVDHSVTLTGPAGHRTRTIGISPPSWMSRDAVGALRLAKGASDLQLAPDATERGTSYHVLTFHDGRYPVRVYIDAGTMLPSAIEATIALDDQHVAESIAWNAMGDIRERMEFINWSFESGIRYPLQQDEFRNGDLYRSFTVRKVRVNAALEVADARLNADEGVAPSSVQAFRIDRRVPGGPYPDKPVAEIAPGIIQIPNSWFSAIVRQDDGLVILDAPISAGYSKSVIAEAERRFPGIPIKALITSTGFFWHVAGVREYAARGIKIYAEARNIPVLERMLRAPQCP